MDKTLVTLDSASALRARQIAHSTYIVLRPEGRLVVTGYFYTQYGLGEQIW